MVGATAGTGKILATYSTAYLYFVSLENGVYRITGEANPAEVSADDGSPDHYFSAGDIITASSPGSDDVELEYVGSSNTGWIGDVTDPDFPDLFIYLSQVSTLEPGSAINVLPGPFDTTATFQAAVFQSGHIYTLQEQNGTFTILGGFAADATATNTGFDQSFSAGEHIDLSFGGEDFNATYVGKSGDGWIGLVEVEGASVPAVYMYFTDDPNIETESVEIDDGPLAVCFMPGTGIATPAGMRPVEELAIGDAVLTATGDVRPVRWIGRQTVVTVFADDLRSLPVRIAAGGLGDGLPCRGLALSPDHALLIDGLLVHAGALVNGTTITRMQGAPERFTYYHIELEDHSLVLAEGVPAETFVDNVTRRRFDNWAEYEALYGAGAPIAELDLPRVKSARQLPHVLRDRIRGSRVAKAA